MVERLLLHQSLLHHRLLLLLLLQSLHFLGLSFDLLSLPRARKCFSWFPRRKKTKTKNREKEKKKRKSLDRKRREASNRVALTNFIEIDLYYFISFYYIDKLKSQAVRKC